MTERAERRRGKWIAFDTSFEFHNLVVAHARQEGMTLRSWVSKVLEESIALGDVKELLGSAISAVMPELEVEIDRKGPGTFYIKW